MTMEERDRRRDHRQPCSRQIWWRGHTDDLFQQGWLVDESRAGMAFLTRASTTPRPGEMVQAMGSESSNERPIPRGIVRRTQMIQSGVALIAVELFAGEEAIVTRAVRQATRVAA